MQGAGQLYTVVLECALLQEQRKLDDETLSQQGRADLDIVLMIHKPNSHSCDHHPNNDINRTTGQEPHPMYVPAHDPKP